ncbi:hypothetical protein [Halalkalibacter wakoensis]|nr:hypothetical protein [Halalkalibacter wakoensis]
MKKDQKRQTMETISQDEINEPTSKEAEKTIPAQKDGFRYDYDDSSDV